MPDLFENVTPLAQTEDFSSATDALRFVYEYSYLPKSILPRFMVEMQRDIQTAWRTGLILCCRERNYTQALVRVHEKQIIIIVKGEAMQKREYLSVIRFFFDQINENLTMKPTMLIPLPKLEKQYVEYEELLAMEKDGETIYKHWKPQKTVFQINELLAGIKTTEEIRRGGDTFISIYGDGNTVANQSSHNNMDIR